jgi:plastocyanin domain-containing protein
MSAAQLIVTAAAVGLIALIAWFFWAPRGEGVRAALSSSGFQEAMILVKGAYTPDVVSVEHGKPVRLSFRREETAACSERVLLPDFGRQATLPEGETIPVEFVPEQPGEYEFTCGMGMLRGKVVVR